MIDNTDIAAAALKPNGIGRCSCANGRKLGKPNPKCPKCKGTGKVKACTKCEGSGWNRETQTKCAICAGNGYVTST